MKFLLSLLTLLLFISAVSFAQPLQPTATFTTVACGSTSFSITAIPNGATNSRWYSDFYCTNALLQNNTYTGTVTGSKMVYVKSFDFASNAVSAKPTQAYIFMPVKPQIQYNVSLNAARNCTWDITATNVPLIDSMTIYPNDDAYIDKGNTGTNFGSSDHMDVFNRLTIYSPLERDMMLKYRLGMIPTGVQIKDARLNVTSIAAWAWGNDGNVYTNLVTDDTWDESTLTWNNQPAVTGAQYFAWWVWGNTATVYSSTTYTDPAGPKYWTSNDQLATVISGEYLGDKTASLKFFSPGYDSRYRSKEFLSDINQVPSLKIKFDYNDNANLTYAWTGPNNFTSSQPSLTGVAPGTYSLHLSSAYCDTTFNVVVPHTTLAAPVVGGPFTYCQWDISTPLTATGADTLRWYTTSVGGDGNLTNPLPGTNLPGTFKYYVQVSDTFGCASPRSEIDVVVNPKPDAPGVTARMRFCSRDSSLTLTATGSNLLWYATPTGGIGSTTAPVVTIKNADSTNFYVSQTLLSCEGYRSRINVFVVPSPIVHFSINKPVICDGDVVTIAAPAGTSGIYRWSPVNLFTNISDPVAQVRLEKTTVLRLDYEDNNGCTGIDTQRVIVDPCCKVIMPDAFTPNGDGKNDAVGIVGSGNIRLEFMRIYNRYGMEVFSSSNLNDRWDGRYQQVPCEIGTYFYVLRYQCGSNEPIMLKGDLTLIR